MTPEPTDRNALNDDEHIMKHPLLPLPERSEEKDKYYAVLGRALAYATEFEQNCRKLAHLFDIENTEQDFGYEVWLLMEEGTLSNKINELVEKHNLSKRCSNEIHKARKARNLIAHEIAINHILMMNKPEGRKVFETHILLAVHEIAAGNQIVLDFTRMLSEDIQGYGSDIVAYYSAIADWILV